MQQLLSKALRMHQSGQLSTAAQLYQQILTHDRDNVDALHLLGVLRHQQGENRLAADLIGRAVILQPNLAVFHNNLAAVYRALGQMDQAADSCRTALGLDPDYPDGHKTLGLIMQGQGKHSVAVEHFRRALQLRSDFSSAHNCLGISLRELKQYDEALTHFRRAVELAPESAPALSNLGQMLLERGQAEEALPHCRMAVQLQPNLAALHHNLGNVLHNLKQNAEARAEYLEALRLNPNLAQSRAHLALMSKQEGRHADAIVLLRRAVELEPKNVGFWQHLAELYDECEKPVEAIPCWERVIFLEPSRASAHLSLGSALRADNRLAEAAESYRAALRLQPDMANALLNLGNLHQETGHLEEAETAYRQALRLQPSLALAHARLAMLLRGRLPDADRAALETRLADSDLRDEFRARLLFALAHVLDARKDYPTAADCLRRANALILEINRGRREYLPAEHERLIEGILSAFGSHFCARTAGMGMPSRRPVFVFGLPRSGTTLVEQVLASHSHIQGIGEPRLVSMLLDSIPRILGRSEPPLECVPYFDSMSLHRLAAQYEHWLHSHAKKPAERIVNKMPDNYLYVGFLAALFPQATFIHCRRDLRDVALSCWMTDFDIVPWANDAQHIATRFRQYLRMMDHWRKVVPVPIHEVVYEETVSDLEGVAHRLIAACGLDWEPACLEYYRTQRPIRTASANQVRQPIYDSSVGRWKNYERELSDLFESLPVR